jgi:hypothetical protein
MRKVTLKLSLKFLALRVLTGAFWFFYNESGFSQTTQLRVIAAQQPGSPLLIVPTFVDSADSLRPRYGYTLTNVSDKPIRAYTVRFGVNMNEGIPITTGSEFVNMPAIKLFLKPNETKQGEGGLGRSYDSPPVKVELSIDFVEFADGTRWGNDESISGDLLDGVRAGGKAALKKYRESIAIDGINQLEQAIANSDSIQPDNQAKSAQWKDGFRTGVSIVKSRLSEAKKKAGQDGVKLELEKPFDSTKGREDQ